MDGVCHVCFEESEWLKQNVQENIQNIEMQAFSDLFCKFVFNVRV